MAKKNDSVFVGIKHDKGQVVVLFSADPELAIAKPVTRWFIDPPEAIDIAEAITTAAFTAREDIKPVGDTLKAELIEKHRKTLTRRVTLMLNSHRENKRLSNSRVAKDVVEACLKEIF